MIVEALWPIFRWVCDTSDSWCAGHSRVEPLSEGDSQHYPRRSHSRVCTSAVQEGREGWVVLGGDPVVTLEGAVPLPKLYSTTHTPSLLTLLPLSHSSPLPATIIWVTLASSIYATCTILHWKNFCFESVLWVRVSPEEPMVIGGTGEMDLLHNPSTSPYYYCMFMFTLHPRLYRPYAT